MSSSSSANTPRSTLTRLVAPDSSPSLPAPAVDSSDASAAAPSSLGVAAAADSPGGGTALAEAEAELVAGVEGPDEATVSLRASTTPSRQPNRTRQLASLRAACAW